MKRRILYVQYTEPAGYPPLEHSSQILARAGWEILFVGIESLGTRDCVLRPHERIEIKRLGWRSGGPLGPLKYAAFHASVAAIARRFRPSWVYASEPLAASAALLIGKTENARLLYHEHDVAAHTDSLFFQLVMKARRQLLRRADLLVVPGEERKAALGEAGRRAHVVWNCPLQDEVAAAHPRAGGTVRLVYAGSITPDRLPLTYIHALARLPAHVQLDVFGYTTLGRPAYAEELKAAAQQAGVGARFRYHGMMSTRLSLLRELNAHDIGIATVNVASTDESMQSLAGPSNKPFDYMACGLPFLVSDTPAWRELFVEPGYAVACDAADADSIVAAVSSMLDPARRASISGKAREKIAKDWNYERQFAPVLKALSA